MSPSLYRRHRRVSHIERPSKTLSYPKWPRSQTHSSTLKRRTLDSLTQVSNDANSTPNPVTIDDLAKIAKRLESTVQDTLEAVDIGTLADCEDTTVGFCKTNIHSDVRSEGENYKIMARTSALDALTDARLPELAERSEPTSSMEAAGGLSARSAGKVLGAEWTLKARLEPALRLSQLVNADNEARGGVPRSHRRAAENGTSREDVLERGPRTRRGPRGSLEMEHADEWASS